MRFKSVKEWGYRGREWDDNFNLDSQFSTGNFLTVETIAVTITPGQLGEKRCRSNIKLCVINVTY